MTVRRNMWAMVIACAGLLCVPGWGAAASKGVAVTGAGGVAVAAKTDSAGGLMGDVRERLQSAAVIRGQFEQKKSVMGFKNPLVSTGDFIVDKNTGVLWHTKSPFESLLTVTRERILSTQSNGQVNSRMDAKSEPGLRTVNEMLFAVMAADLETLSQRFEIAGDLEGSEGWRLSLTPKDKALAQWLTRIDLEGDRFVRTVRMQEAQGDASVIRFMGQSVTKSLSPEDVRRFE